MRVGRSIIADQFFQGRIDDVGIWTRALTAEEILAVASDPIASYIATTTVNVTISSTGPTVAIVGAPASGSEGTGIALTSTTNGTIDTYAWSVVASNGQAIAGGTGANFSFTPSDNGTYTVSLQVTDNDGGMNTTSQVIAVTNVAPSATILGAPASVAVGTLVALTSTVSDPGTADTFSYLWTVVACNGQTIAGGTTSAYSFTPSTAGQYTVTLVVTDDDGATATHSAVIDATAEAPAVAIQGAPANSPEGTALTLTASVTNPTASDSYLWTVVASNGQTIASGNNSSFTFTPHDNGTYTISLALTGDNGAASDQRVVTVQNVAPAVTINGAPATSVPEGTTIAMASTVVDPGSVDTHTYLWTVVASNGQAITAAMLSLSR